MAQHDYDIANQSFPSFRSDLNSVLEAINTSNSGTSRPTSAVAGTVWLDTTNATNPTLKFFDGTDDISLAQFDYSANTVNWLDSTVIADFNLIDDTTPQLGGNLDVNGNSIVSVSNGNITFTPDGTGKVIIDGLSYPSSDGTSGQFLKTDGAGNLSFDTVTTAGTVLTTQGDILYRDGSGLARLGAGTSGQVLQTNGTGANPSWGTVAGSSDAFSAYDMSSNASGTLVLTNTFLNDGSNYSTSTGRYTAPSAGKYFFYFHALNAGGGSDLYFEKNGVDVGAGVDYGNSPDTATTGSLSIILNLSTSDYVTVNATSNVYTNYIVFNGFKIY